MRRALFLSPHFDDVAFSCGGTFAALAADGWETTLCTVFARSVPDPSGFALACQLDKGLAPDVDYMALRRREDDAAAVALGAAHVERYDFAEAPHRGYENAAALFGPFVDRDDVAARLVERLGSFDAYDLIFAPQALGHHVDHRRVRAAVFARANARDARLRWYRDAPYVLRAPGDAPHDEIASAYAHATATVLDERALGAKLDACAAYTTQLAFQFGSETRMRDALAAFQFGSETRMRDALATFARDEGTRSDRRGPCERFVIARET